LAGNAINAKPVSTTVFINELLMTHPYEQYHFKPGHSFIDLSHLLN